jgi:choline dehydrogenase-like flavoprotein
MPATFKYWELDRRTLDRLRVGDLVMDGSDISVNTGHPQGGNPISRDPNRGVIDETFRVHGVENLHVCDASVFPTAITVNPQLTVMALAHYAAVAHIGR